MTWPCGNSIPAPLALLAERGVLTLPPNPRALVVVMIDEWASSIPVADPLSTALRLFPSPSRPWLAVGPPLTPLAHHNSVAITTSESRKVLVLEMAPSSWSSLNGWCYEPSLASALERGVPNSRTVGMHAEYQEKPSHPVATGTRFCCTHKHNRVGGRRSAAEFGCPKRRTGETDKRLSLVHP
ncbi:hypothetical protein B0T10DRAFT_454198 [Thelonectria olida]|uniref:Uncharacterized protein n=1 Tax=Thelonectria olida TaxID=1576542 RepID=A0A9P8WKA6_9HYPO|nr:hypothetical protein B0T10DRAFT_454198 [Thelonectria olida]